MINSFCVNDFNFSHPCQNLPTPLLKVCKTTNNLQIEKGALVCFLYIYRLFIILSKDVCHLYCEWIESLNLDLLFLFVMKCNYVVFCSGLLGSQYFLVRLFYNFSVILFRIGLHLHFFLICKFSSVSYD